MVLRPRCAPLRLLRRAPPFGGNDHNEASEPLAQAKTTSRLAENKRWDLRGFKRYLSNFQTAMGGLQSASSQMTKPSRRRNLTAITLKLSHLRRSQL